MAFWSGEKIIAEQAAHPNLVTPFDAYQIDCNAYTLRLASEYFVTADSRQQRPRQLLTPGQSFFVPPGQFAFLLTKETISIPQSAMAFISMKASFKFRGLINVSGFHVDPGYQGQLVFSIYNAGSNPVELTEGIPLFLIWFADLDRPSKTPFIKSGGGAKSISPALVSGMSGRILSLQALSDDIESVKRDMSVQRALFIWGVGLAGGFWVTIVGALFADYLTEAHKGKALAPAPSISAPAVPSATPNISPPVPQSSNASQPSTTSPPPKAAAQTATDVNKLNQKNQTPGAGN